MRSSREVLTGIGLATSLALGANACSSPSHHAEKAPVVSQYTQRLQQLASNIINLTSRSPNRFTSKPPYSVGFDIPTTNGGKLGVEVQTPTAKPDAAKVEMIDVQQTISGQPSFDLSFYIRNDGSWNAYCQDNVSTSTGGISEIGQKTVQAGNKVEYKNVADANAVLSDDITNATNTIEAMASHVDGSAIGPLADICRINLGGG